MKKDARYAPGYFPPSNARVISNLRLSITQYSSDINTQKN